MAWPKIMFIYLIKDDYLFKYILFVYFFNNVFLLN